MACVRTHFFHGRAPGHKLPYPSDLLRIGLAHSLANARRTTAGSFAMTVR